MRRLFEIACLCSEVELQSDGTGALRIEGSGTETALVRAAMDAGFDPRQIRARHPLSRIQHRSEAYRFMATLHHSPGGSLVAVKGDAIEVISRCKQVLEPDGQVRSLTEADRASALQANDEMASRALRVLGFAYVEIIGRSDKITAEDLTWVGLAGLADPVRPGVGEVLKRLEKAGVRSIILTGDAPVTARAVAAEIGLGNGRELRVLTADELDRLEPGERANCAATVDVFARVSPAQSWRSYVPCKAPARSWQCWATASTIVRRFGLHTSGSLSAEMVTRRRERSPTSSWRWRIFACCFAVSKKGAQHRTMFAGLWSSCSAPTAVRCFGYWLAAQSKAVSR